MKEKNSNGACRRYILRFCTYYIFLLFRTIINEFFIITNKIEKSLNHFLALVSGVMYSSGTYKTE